MSTQASACSTVFYVHLVQAECRWPHGLNCRHVAKLWDTNGTILSQVIIPPSEFNGTAKWVQWPIGPVVIGPGPQYMITVSDGTEKGHHWAGCPSCWLPAGSNGRHIFWPAGSARFGLFSNGSDMPGAFELPLPLISSLTNPHGARNHTYVRAKLLS